MGVDYTVLIYDDFDWNYANGDKEYHKQELTNKLREVYPFVTLEAEWHGYMVFDLDRKQVAEKLQQIHDGEPIKTDRLDDSDIRLRC